MEVRDAVEEDAGALAAIADAPPDVMCDLIHDRTVRVAERRQSGDGPNLDADAIDAEVLGFVSFDAREDVVDVTGFGGTEDACELLLGEPIRFARKEGMAVEVVVPAAEDEMRAAVEAVGFGKAADGPTFGGEPTVRYRFSP
ncbi:hypothetical protein [Halegenticoccus tardaugens]|uniref:hypothetical protein n=1 Tax=Halegenticoccus tardaugens TaxID=2071624 RepID=UPI00100ABFDC|nr:hypothetical protein [Halegenticoccus tardaugens]